MKRLNTQTEIKLNMLNDDELNEYYLDVIEVLHEYDDKLTTIEKIKLDEQAEEIEKIMENNRIKQTEKNSISSILYGLKDL